LNYRNTLDNFKRQLGLPPTMAMQPDFSPLRPMSRQLERFQQIIDQYTATVEQAERDPGAANTTKVRDQFKLLFRDSPLVRGTRFRERVAQRWGLWEKRSSE